MYAFKTVIYAHMHRSGEMAQHLRQLVHTENLNSIPAHTWQLTTVRNSSFRGSNTLFQSPGQHTNGYTDTETYMQANAHSHKVNKNKQVLKRGKNTIGNT